MGTDDKILPMTRGHGLGAADEDEHDGCCAWNVLHRRTRTRIVWYILFYEKEDLSAQQLSHLCNV